MVDRHLDDCVALEILHGAFPMQHPSLRIAHVIGAISLPDTLAHRVKADSRMSHIFAL